MRKKTKERKKERKKERTTQQHTRKIILFKEATSNQGIIPVIAKCIFISFLVTTIKNIRTFEIGWQPLKLLYKAVLNTRLFENAK